jgi:two-component system, chemotaxis family, response regulator Rcp1
MPRILVVEDNPGDQNLIETLLRQWHSTLEIEISEDGDQALTRLNSDTAERDVDLVLIDWNVPRRNGREVLDALARHPRFRRTPVVVLSSSDAPNDLADAYDLGASGYLVKPNSYQEFSDRMRAFVDYWFSAARLPPPLSATAQGR